MRPVRRGSRAQTYTADSTLQHLAGGIKRDQESGKLGTKLPVTLLRGEAD